MNSLKEAIEILDKGPIILCGRRRPYWISHLGQAEVGFRFLSDSALRQYIISVCGKHLCHDCRYITYDGCQKRLDPVDLEFSCWEFWRSEVECNY